MNIYFSDISTSPLVPKSLGGSTNLNHVQSIQQINGHPSPLRHVKSEERLNDDGSTSSASSPGCGNRGGSSGGEVSLPVTTSMTNLSLKQVADLVSALRLYPRLHKPSLSCKREKEEVL